MMSWDGTEEQDIDTTLALMEAAEAYERETEELREFDRAWTVATWAGRILFVAVFLYLGHLIGCLIDKL